ncbi:MAG: FG-GAP-like repeat-containing protein, partial [Gammaproteobacteria bacterium]|nr:FG-GAP-like repeat-containing protein [Gammaproteobacteria bacterium]
AIATLNRDEEGDVTQALSMLYEVLAVDKDHLRAHYLAGLLHLYQGEVEASNAHLERVIAADPNDAYAHLFFAQNLIQISELARALTSYQYAMDVDPYLRSAYYGASLALRRLDREDEALAMLELFERLNNNPRARLAEFKYTRMGPKAEAISIGSSAKPPPATPVGELFAPPVDLDLAGLTTAAHLTAVDINADGKLDIFVTGQDSTRVLLGNADGAFDDVTDHPLAGLENVNAAFWGDVDNDGGLDVYLCNAGPNQLWSLRADEWMEIAGDAGVNDEGVCVDGGVLDADHDGDLDIYVANASGADELFSNNLNGSFRGLMAAGWLANPGSTRQFLAADFDGDRDVDLVTLNTELPNSVWTNDRLWRYEPFEALSVLAETALAAAVSGDLDADGSPEIYGVSMAGKLVKIARASTGSWTLETQINAAPEGAYLAVQDFDGDGIQDLLVGANTGIRILLGGTQEQLLPSSGMDAGQAIVLSDNAAQGPSLVAPITGGLRLWRPGSGRHGFLGLTFSGKQKGANTMRSNRSGIGTQIALRVLDRWTIASKLDVHSGPGQSLQPLLMGLGGRSEADYVAVNWSDGVFQTELGLQPARVHHIEETQRQLSSCPVLFAWNGSDYGFVSDILGVGGLGFFAEPGVANTPRPWENLLLPVGALVARDDRYLLKISEPMEENAYLDAVRLRVYDLPDGWDMVLDERMATGAPEVSGRAIFYRNTIPFLRAFDQTGAEVSEQLRHTDGRAPPLPDLDARFIGRTHSKHVLELEFAEALNQQGAHPVLVANGWLEYPYSQTVFAAWQADATFDPPTLSARGEDGKWVTVYESFGYPAGMPRTMALPLNDLPPLTKALRLTGNLEVYWDQIFIALEETPDAVVIQMIPLKSARLAKTGFPRRTTGPQRRPDYDYQDRQPFWDARYLPGVYTRLGPVTPLLTQVDDAVVIVGSGEEVHLEFEALMHPLQGQHRRIVVEGRGWAKDMDLYTLNGDTVGPLPTRGTATPADAERRRVLHESYNVRYQSGG